MLQRSGILVVCEGNICRSPMAALALQQSLGSIEGLETTSAGLRAVVGRGMDAAAEKQAVRLGIDPSPHVARQLTESMIQASALILPMTLGQRQRILEMDPVAMRRTFTLKEFALVAEQAPDTDGEGVTFADLARWGSGARAKLSHYDLDVDDPYRRETAVHERVADEIDIATRQIIRRLTSV